MKVYCENNNLEIKKEYSWITQVGYDKKVLSMKQEQGVLQVELEEHTKADYDFLNTV